MKAKALSLTVFLFLCLTDRSNLCAREWTDATGKHRLKAELVDCQDGRVRLAREDGTIISVPLSQLSVADQEYAQSMTNNGSDAHKPDSSNSPSGKVPQ